MEQQKKKLSDNTSSDKVHMHAENFRNIVTLTSEYQLLLEDIFTPDHKHMDSLALTQ